MTSLIVKMKLAVMAKKIVRLFRFKFNTIRVDAI